MKYLIGSIVALIAITLLASLAGQFLLAQKMRSEVKHELFGDIKINRTVTVNEQDLSALPAPVSQWLKNSGIIGKPKAQVLRLKQNGTLRKIGRAHV